MPENRTDTVVKNLDKIRRARLSLTEKEIAHIAELAEVLCDEAGEDEIFFFDDAFISRYKRLTEDIPKGDVAAFNADRVEKGEKLHTCMQKAFLCMRICDILGIKGVKDAGTFFDDLSENDVNNISCVRSPLTDEAYMRFSSVLEETRVVYADDLNEVCENVYYGKTSFCILPIASTVDGRLTGIRTLAMKYGLKTAYTCRVTNADGQSTVLALMKKELSLPFDEEGAAFEFRVDPKERLTELLCVLEGCGMKATSVVFTAEGGGLCDITAKIDADGFCGFLSYLYLEHPNFAPMGLFNEI